MTATKKPGKPGPSAKRKPASTPNHGYDAGAGKPILGVDLKGELLDIPIDSIIDPAGPADRMARPGDEAAISQLARSMAECGQLQPVMLEQLVDGRFCRVFGRRRIAAARSLGWPTIRASVVQPLPDDVRRTVVAIENVQRQDLTPAEETLAVDELMLLQAPAAARQLARPLLDGCGAWSGRLITAETAAEITTHAGRHDLLLDYRVRGLAAELVAAMLGKPASWVRDRLYIGRLSDHSKKLVLEGKLPLAHAREISKVADEKRRDELCKAYAAGGSDSISDDEPGKLEELQEEVRRCVFALHVVPWNRSVAFAGRGPCEGCQHNSATNPGLFEGGGEVSLDMVGGRGTYDRSAADSAKVVGAGICTLPSCYAEKLRATKAAVSAAAKRIVEGGTSAGSAKVPAFVSPAAVDAKVRDRKKALSSRGRQKRGSKPAAPSAEQLRREARENAERKWHAEMEKRAREIEPKIAAKLLANPGTWAVYTLLRLTKIYEGTHHYQSEKRQRAADSPAMAALLKHLQKPGWDAVVAIAKECDRRSDLLRIYSDGRSGMAEKFAAALGIELMPAPTLESFLPKEPNQEKAQAEKPATKSGKAGAASRFSARSTAARSTRRSGGKASPARKPAADPAGDETHESVENDE